MNKFALFLLIAIGSIICSCGSTSQPLGQEEETSTDLIRSNSENALKTGELDGATNNEEEEEYYFYIARKWELGEDYINIKGDGMFDAELDGIAMTGKWGMSSNTEDKQVLTFVGLGEHKGTIRTYEIITISLERLVAIDKNGNRINFLAAK